MCNRYWLKSDYALYIKPFEKALLIEIVEQNNDYRIGKFRVLPFRVAFLLKLMTENHIKDVKLQLMGIGIDATTADKLVKDLYGRFSPILPTKPVGEKCTPEEIEKLVYETFGKNRFDYEKGQFSYPINVIIEVNNGFVMREQHGRIKNALLDKIHADCYANNVNAIIYMGKDLIQDKHIGSYYKKK